ncbi:origin recognition complex subunit 5 C-terminus-domain-containing protein [Boeremia exigua]|uniref:origin recognition complex subunit 5 C-terminus-domain-containing protein n=1 Tax=Boeremia exigua TaxID=749465 RepID=UPI001E8EC5CD|nr:origin recognition complex subunit 5 C-terminus-domain-containing protein [Boeremia exigua]KAH6642395.1 origin recognition complex subunit 5 C-terminus-domain-containing protein [Boeremia exigua]
MLPDEIIAQLVGEFACRDQQIQHLAALYTEHLPLPPFANVHGLTATGKSSILRSYLHLTRLPYAIINVRECITARHLLERIVAASLDAVEEAYDETVDRRPYARTENLSALCVNLQRMLEGRGRFVLVLDAIDKLREGGGTLIAALGRLGERIPNLAFIVTTTLAITPALRHASSIPYIAFPSYTRPQLLTILSKSPPKVFTTPPSADKFPDYTPDLAAEDDAWLWNRFLGAVYDSLSKHTGRDLLSFRAAALRLWPQFVAPVVMGEFGTRDFSRLMVNRRHLFQGEEAVLDRIIAPKSVSTEKNGDVGKAITRKAVPGIVQNLPFYTSHLLIAAYLASYNPARTDVTYFMKHTDKRKNKRRAPSAASLSATSKGGVKHRRIPRHLLTPSPFPLDRLFAIFRALLVDGVPQTADLYTSVATLTSLKLLVRTGMGGASDALEAGGRWRVGFGWEFARGLGRGVGIEVGEYLVGGVD